MKGSELVSQVDMDRGLVACFIVNFGDCFVITLQLGISVLYVSGKFLASLVGCS